jgi:hypothetical protein
MVVVTAFSESRMPELYPQPFSAQLHKEVGTLFTSLLSPSCTFKQAAQRSSSVCVMNSVHALPHMSFFKTLMGFLCGLMSRRMKPVTPGDSDGLHLLIESLSDQGHADVWGRSY